MVGTVPRDGQVTINDDIQLTPAQWQMLEDGGNIVGDYRLSFTDAFGEVWSYEHTLMVDKRSLGLGYAYTLDCFHVRHEEDESDEIGAQRQRLPLEGGRDGRKG